MRELLTWYHKIPDKTLSVMAQFHTRYEALHPFQDGNGRTGRLILFRECLKADLTSVVIEDKYRTRYIEGLKEYRETGKTALLEALFTEEQKEYAKKVDYFLGEDV
ncbi:MULTISPECIES: Fic family protein [unclassified Eubacterium (in: firmicutes)]|uniref:Fic family protein n=1 Tax=unclassified Eubacterium (in: firmicutes) TaxID=2624479 RepID=UPI0031B89CF5